MRKILIFLLCLFFAFPAMSASLINDTETEKFLSELITPLTTAAGIPENRLKIHIVKGDEFNAFVMGGEDVFIYSGLLSRVKTPSALQAVVAHELGHTLGGHMAQMSQRMKAELTRTMLIQALGVGLMVAGGNPSLGAGILAGSPGIARQSMMAFTRDEERIADKLGFDLMVKSGQNVNGFLEIFEQLNDSSYALESRLNPNAVNHPLTSERLKNIREQIDSMSPKYKPNKKREAARKAQYDLIRAKLVGYLDDENRVKTLYPFSDKSDAAEYARAIASMQAGNLKDAQAGTLVLISHQPKNPYFYELLGDVEYQFGHYDDSVKAYEKSLDLAGDAPQIQTALALVLTERAKSGDREKAVELCKTAILAEPMPLTYWVLARAEKDGPSDWAMAEYYNLIGDKKNTQKYAKKARKSLPKNSPEYVKSGDLLK